MLGPKFFDHIRQHTPGGQLSQRQVQGLVAIEAGWQKWGVKNLNLFAYILATVARETGWQFQPVKETQFGTDVVPSDATVKTRLTKAWKSGKLKWVKKDYWSSGWFGRGLVQLTHEFNYKGPAREAVLEEFGVDIYKNPDLLLRQDISIFVLIRGSLEGWFTGVGLTKYIDDLDEDVVKDYEEYVQARRVINGQDAAAEIAKTATVFEEALKLDVTVPPNAPIPAETVGGAPSQPEPATAHPGKMAGQRGAGKWGWVAIVIFLIVVAAAIVIFKP